MTFGRPLLIVGHLALALVLAVGFGLVFGGVVMVAWNAAIPTVLKLPPLTYWQAVAVLVLMRILVGRFTHSSHGARGCTRGHRGISGRASEPEAALYGPWWEAEGKAAFEAYAARHLGCDGSGRD